MKAYLNRDDLDFGTVADMQPLQKWELQENLRGEIEYPTKSVHHPSICQFRPLRHRYSLCNVFAELACDTIHLSSELLLKYICAISYDSNWILCQQGRHQHQHHSDEGDHLYAAIQITFFSDPAGSPNSMEFTA